MQCQLSRRPLPRPVLVALIACIALGACTHLEQYRTDFTPCVSDDLERDCRDNVIQEYRPAAGGEIRDHNDLSDPRIAEFLTHLILVASQSEDPKERSTLRARGLSVE